GNISADTGFTRAGVNNVGVRRRDGDRADRANLRRVRQRSPIAPGIRGFPNAAGHSAHVIDVRISRNAGNGQRASAAHRTNQSPEHRFPQIRVERLRARYNRTKNYNGENSDDNLKRTPLLRTHHTIPPGYLAEAGFYRQ